jgi:hypothetical protein
VSPAAAHRAQQSRRTTTRTVMIQTTRIHLGLDIILALRPVRTRFAVLFGQPEPTETRGLAGLIR